MPLSHLTPYTTVLFASWTVFTLVWWVAARNAKPSRKSLHWLTRLGMRLLLAGAVVLLIRNHDLASLHQTTGAVAFTGCVLCVSGTAFMLWARYSLGKNWGMPMTLRVDPELVTLGPYAFVRHPIYTGMFVTMIGTTLVVPLYFVLALFSSVYFTVSALREEKDMLAKFPERYGAYRQRTKMFFPFLF
jgi:protein-S-isoprenylcysteine O-methyltransferase Ste14